MCIALGGTTSSRLNRSAATAGVDARRGYPNVKIAVNRSQNFISRLADILRFSCMTPPLDEEEENELTRSLEAKARTALEQDGCPPCYPRDIDVPLRDLPNQYKPIIEYWRSFAGTGDAVLCAQLAKWRQFRKCQRKDRSPSRNRSFSDFVSQTRERLRRHGIDVIFTLRLDPCDQTRLEDWLEYQNHGLRRLEQLERKRAHLQAEIRLGCASEEARGLVFEGATYIETLHIQLKRIERDVERHNTLLHWIEQERQKMIGVAKCNEFSDKIATGCHWRNRLRSSRTMRREIPAVRGEVRVSKAVSSKRSKRSPRPEVRSVEQLTDDPRDIQPEDSYLPCVGANSLPARTKDSSFKARLQTAVPIKRSPSNRVRTWPGNRRRRDVRNAPANPRKPYQVRGAHDQVQPLELYKTRSGRISKRPSRWAPS
ncbi:hypothetical protein HIM_10114 [Hirsutella minnesotensis 3608]|uniref:Uncharacterized protein n=1 Tax=Hirsutella minnesotensis 3608 TaxID=1043627 RepID=A0A0F7ZKE4_9HYPO|nr:hypothetical protein HIM_10114 [Hirsutella minnesotensis 3608]